MTNFFSETDYRKEYERLREAKRAAEKAHAEKQAKDAAMEGRGKEVPLIHSMPAEVESNIYLR